MAFPSKLVAKLGDDVVGSAEVKPAAEGQYPMDILIQQFSDVNLTIELQFKDTVLSQQVAIVRTPFRRSISIDCVHKNFGSSSFHNSSLEPKYGRIDFTYPPSLMILVDPAPSDWGKNRADKLSKLVSGGAQIVLIAGSTFLQNRLTNKTL